MASATLQAIVDRNTARLRVARGETVADVTQTIAAPTTAPTARPRCQVCNRIGAADNYCKTHRVGQTSVPAPAHAPLQTATNVKNGRILPATDLSVDGFDFVLSSGKVSADKFAVVKSRTSTNPWRDVVASMAKEPCSFLTITRSAGSTAKSPLSAIRSALSWARDTEVRHWNKLRARSGADKGTWYIIRDA